jgi:light-regulated signal transduction histidine kinase (bacteriophytochrome)
VIGELDHVICALQDITDEFLLTQSLSKSRDELKILTEDLKIKTEQLSKSNADLEQFAYAASHDLQEPLRMVTSFLTKLNEKYGELFDEKGKRYLYFAVDGALRMKQLVNDILAFSKVGSAAEALQPVDIQQIIDEIKIMQRSEIELSKARFVCSPMPEVNTLKTPLKQVFSNLVSNALKYRRADTAPIIEITASETASHYQFLVKDNGIGVSPEYFEKIFIIFKRLHAKDEYNGTGIGLAIVKKNVELLGGRIWIESEPGEGSTFYFTIAKTSQPVLNSVAVEYLRKIEF